VRFAFNPTRERVQIALVIGLLFINTIADTPQARNEQVHKER
jgi:hypothetical protein